MCGGGGVGWGNDSKMNGKECVCGWGVCGWGVCVGGNDSKMNGKERVCGGE